MTSNHYNVVIVGAGPAGSSCATMLARAGMKVLIYEKAKFPREKICGDCVNPKSWKLFDVLGVADTLRSRLLSKIDGIKITNSKGKTIESCISSHRNAPFFAIKRGELDELLLSNAKKAGAAAMEETRVTDIRRTNGWEVFANQNGSEKIFSCDVLIGADGRNSIVAQKIAGSSYVENDKKVNAKRVGVQWHTQHQPSIGSSVEMFFFGSGYGGVVNVGMEHANVALVTHPDIAQLARQNFPEFLGQTLLNNPRVRLLFSDLAPVGEIYSAYPINPVRHAVHHPSALLIGDARQTVEPFTGEGVYFALQDGIETAGKIVQLFKWGTPARVVESHSKFWVNTVYSPIFRRPSVAERFIAAGFRIPRVVSFIVRTVLG